ncbi:MAG: 2-isopropylmalate synthase [Bacteroidota bacterium]
MSNQVYIFDTTLRDGEQAPGASMSLSEKIKIAHQLAKLNVDIIEAGFPISSPQDAESVRQIAAEVSGPVICALARATDADIHAAGKSLVPGKNTRIHTFIATSDIHLDAKFSSPRFGSTMAERRNTVVKMAVDAITLARTYTDNVEFSAEDAGRTDIAYLCDMVQACIEAGATTINLPDTTGYCTPSEYASIFKQVIERLKPADDIIFSTHCHDDLGMAVANSLSGVLAGARQIECTINGIGERAGNASLEEVVMAMNVRAERFGVHTNINTRALMESSNMVQIASGFAVPPNKAIVGKNAFSHEAGIHQHGVLKSRETYEIMRAEDVGQDAEQIRLGRHSGRHGFLSRLEKMGLEVPEESRDELYTRFLALADQKKEIFEADLYDLYHEKNSLNKPDYVLEKMEVRVDTGTAARASVTIFHTRMKAFHTETATGDGPVEALYRAINHAVGTAHELISYSIQSITEGADAVGEVRVFTGTDNQQFSGEAKSTDVLKASAEAYLASLNKLVAGKRDEANQNFIAGGIIDSFDRIQ